MDLGMSEFTPRSSDTGKPDEDAREPCIEFFDDERPGC